MRFDQQFFKSIIPDVKFSGSKMPENISLSVDSRQVKKGDIFIALKGNKVDGHDFISDAIVNGAAGLIIDKKREDVLKKLESKINNLFVAVVSDSKETLLKLARTWREEFSIPVVGITGSVGKTSTKEILSNILKVNNNKFIASYGNQNTVIGIALNILRLTSECEVAVFEVGINKRDEMAQMADLLRPTIAIITAIGHSHMEGLGSLNDIANEKRDIFKYFKEDNVGIINGDMPMLANISYNHPIIKFGFKTTNQVQARKVQANNNGTNFILKLYKEKLKVHLDSGHTGRVNNALAATAAAYLLEIKSDIIVKGIEMPIAISGRFEQVKIKSNKGIIIDDCYNASPESMKAALLAFEKLESKGQKIAVLGDMLELGVNSPFWHRQLGRVLRKVPSLNHVILVGDLVKSTKSTMPVDVTFDHVGTWQEALKLIKTKLDKDSTILIKGSNGVGLTNIVKEIS